MTRLKHFAWSVENWLKGYKFGPVQRCRWCGHTTPCPRHRQRAGGGHTADSETVRDALLRCDEETVSADMTAGQDAALAERDRAREWVSRIWVTAEQETWDERNGPNSWALSLKREYRAQLTAAEAERDAALARAELAEGKAQQNACDWADVKDERDAAHAELRGIVRYLDSDHYDDREKLGMIRAACADGLARAVLGGPDA